MTTLLSYLITIIIRYYHLIINRKYCSKLTLEDRLNMYIDPINPFIHVYLGNNWYLNKYELNKSKGIYPT